MSKSDGGKGSSPRPYSVTQAEYEETLCQLGVGGDDVAYYCANIVKEGGEDYE